MIAAYKGTSAISRLIRLRTWSDYSHIADVEPVNGVVTATVGDVIEAWTSGVRAVCSLSEAHSPGTTVDLFDIVDQTPEQRVAQLRWLHDQLGKRYDFMGIMRFINLAHEDDASKWFCSEMEFQSVIECGCDPLLERIQAHVVYPGMVVYSPRLRFVKTLVTADTRLSQAADERATEERYSVA